MGEGKARLRNAGNTLTPDKYYHHSYSRYCVGIGATFTAPPKTAIALGTTDNLRKLI